MGRWKNKGENDVADDDHLQQIRAQMLKMLLCPSSHCGVGNSRGTMMMNVGDDGEHRETYLHRMQQH